MTFGSITSIIPDQMMPCGAHITSYLVSFQVELMLMLCKKMMIKSTFFWVVSQIGIVQPNDQGCRTVCFPTDSKMPRRLNTPVWGFQKQRIIPHMGVAAMSNYVLYQVT
jgi:hypothetical protein